MSKNTLEFQCPSCTKRVGIEEAQVGSTMACTYCGSIVRVPSDPALLFHVRPDLVRKPTRVCLGTVQKNRGFTGKNLKKWATLIVILILVFVSFGGYKTYQYFETKKQTEVLRHKKLEKERQSREAEGRRIEEQRRLAAANQLREEEEAKRLEKEKQQLAVEEKQREQERQQLAKAEAEARRKSEEKEKEEASKLELEQGEIALIRQTEKELVAVLKQAQFKEAIENLRLIENRLKTNKGKEEYVLSQERISRVQEFHKDLVILAAGFRFSRGGIIESSNQTEITMLGKKVLWSDIYATRPEIVNELIEGLVLREQPNSTASIMKKTKLITNAALCLYLFYSDSAFALEKAKRMLVRSLKDAPDNMNTVKKLFPDIVDDLSDIKYQPDCKRCKERYCIKCKGSKMCAACSGAGVVTCPSCSGQGQVRGKGRAMCARCGGTGDRPEFGTTCMTCNGTGSVAQATLSAGSSCGRTGRVKCEACYGERACPTCNGTGTSGDRCPGCGKN